MSITNKTICSLLLTVFLIAFFALPAHARVDYVKETKKSCINCHINTEYPGRSFFEAEDQYKWTFFWLCLSVTALFFTYGIYSRVYIWRKGKRGEPGKKGVIDTLRSLLLEGLLQRGILKLSVLRWVNYLTLSLGFLCLLMVMLIVYALALSLGVKTFMIQPPFGLVLDFLVDLFGLSVLVGVIISFARRYVLRSPQLKSTVEDNIALVLIFVIIFTGFLVEAARLSVLPITVERAFSFFGFAMAYWMRDLPFPWGTYHFYLWNIHMLLAFAFVAYIPYSRFIHIITSPISTARSK
ncbi:MAG: respiratory nitrate reductase subunit gamma [Deltaproteobacteria bacterium]|nr:MAG: respiratory nitrate reductase subunit gamma [Deltaproteobacteria bacterium]